MFLSQHGVMLSAVFLAVWTGNPPAQPLRFCVALGAGQDAHHNPGTGYGSEPCVAPPAAPGSGTSMGFRATAMPMHSPCSPWGAHSTGRRAGKEIPHLSCQHGSFLQCNISVDPCVCGTAFQPLVLLSDPGGSAAISRNALENVVKPLQLLV